MPGIISYVSDREKALKGTGTWSWIKLVCHKLGCITFPTKSYRIFTITNYYWRHLALVWDNNNFATLHSRVIVASCSVEYKYKLPPPDHSLTEFVRVCWPSLGHTMATGSGFRWGIHRFTIKCTSMCHEAHPELYLWSYMPSSLCGWCALSSRVECRQLRGMAWWVRRLNWLVQEPQALVAIGANKLTKSFCSYSTCADETLPTINNITSPS